MQLHRELCSYTADEVCMKKTKGFTLVELLVVISIIALLLAILIPALNKVKRTSQRIVCGSNMHQWSLAVGMYASDNRNFFPYNGVTEPPGYQPVNWDPADLKAWWPGFDLMWNSRIVQNFWAKYLVKADIYLSSKKNNVLFCPTSLAGRNAATNPTYAMYGGICGYNWLPGRESAKCAMDYRFAEMDYTTGNIRNSKLWVDKQRLGQYSRSPILVDTVQSTPVNQGGWFSGSIPWSSHAGPGGQPEGQNFLFEDGHTVWVAWKKIDLKVRAQQKPVLGSMSSGQISCYYRIPLGSN